MSETTARFDLYNAEMTWNAPQDWKSIGQNLTAAQAYERATAEDQAETTNVLIICYAGTEERADADLIF